LNRHARAPHPPQVEEEYTVQGMGKLPPLRNIQAALRETSETLARELANPTANAPDWSECEWRIARAVAVLHGISSLLPHRVPWRGPPGWSRFLVEQTSHTEDRQLRIRALLGALDAAAGAAGIPFVALKGAALQAAGLYGIGERPMADLDLLIDTADAKAMTQILEDMRFGETAVTWKHRVFEASVRPGAAPFGEHSDNGIKIDLHVRIRELLPRRPVDVTDLILPLRPRPGLNPYRSPAALMIHLLLHAAGAILTRTLRLVQLHDLALLSQRMSGQDWDEVLAATGPPRGLWWAVPPLTLVERYYRVIPARVLAAASAQCRSALLRTAGRRLLWEVSFSDMRRSVFPGIEWARSAGEALAYVVERTLLSARILSGAPVPGATAAVAGVSAASTSKVPPLRWMALRPLRPATLNAVRYAFAQPG